MVKVAKELVALLRSLAEGEVADTDWGICDHVANLAPVGADEMLDESFMALYRRAGYPVPAPENFRPDRVRFGANIDTYTSFPLWEGEYGENRKRVCREVADWVEKHYV